MRQAFRKLGILLIPAVALSLSGCGAIEQNFGRKAASAATAGSTKVSFSSGPRLTVEDVLVGGMMIYAVSSTSGVATQGFYFASESAASAVVLPNGTYQFYAYGYDGAIDNSSTVVRCGGNGSTVTLDGTDVTIPITLSVTGCSAASFSDGSTTYSSSFGVVLLNFFRCYSGAYSGAMTNGMSTSLCVPNTSSAVNSAKLFINSYTSLNDTSTWQTAFTSGCYAAGTTNYPSTGGPRIPQSASNNFLAMTVVTYSDGSCATPLNTYQFTQGPVNSSTSATSANVAYNSGSPGVLVLRDF